MNLSLLTSQQQFTIDFVRELRRLIDKHQEKTKKFLLTASPRCITTHAGYLVPTFEQSIDAFDSLYVRFSDGICTLNNVPRFNQTLQNWLNRARQQNGPDIYIGISAGDQQTNANYVTLDVLNTVYRVRFHPFSLLTTHNA